jgi:hypothetical protein
MNAMHIDASDRVEGLLPGSLRRHPALVRLRACLLAQRPTRESVDAVCDRLLIPVSDGAEEPTATSSALLPITPTD